MTATGSTLAERRAFINNVLKWAILARVGAIAFLHITQAMGSLRLSPDAEMYHRVAVEIQQTHARGGVETLRTWQDHGWFRFTAAVYDLVGPHPLAMELINAVFGVLTLFLAWRLAWRTTGVFFVAQMTALCVAFFPSFILWSCMGAKDALGILAMVTLVSAATELRDRFDMRWLLAAIAALVVFLGIRDYMFLVGGVLFLLAMFPYTPDRKRSLPSAVISVAAVVVLLPTLLGYGPFAIQFYEESQYLDLEYINRARVDIGDHGSGAMFHNNRIATWGDDFNENAKAALLGLYYFFFVLDLSSIDSVRQLLVLPEVMITIALLRPLIRGVRIAYQKISVMWPMLLFSFVLMAVYLAATTNVGALFRWKLQIMPFFAVFIGMGMWARQRSFLFRASSRIASWFVPKASGGAAAGRPVRASYSEYPASR